MRKFASFSIALSLFALAALPALAVGAQKYSWHLSGSVMPVPPYGSGDIVGSDTASKLIVVEPNGKVKTGLTGTMSGLAPDTTYTVFLSQPYTPYSFTNGNVAGSWVVSFEYQGGYYSHDMTLSQDGSGNLTGSGGNPAGGPHTYEWSVTSGTVSGNTVDFYADYTLGNDALTPLTTMHVVGTIQADGSISGTWSDNYQGGSRSGTFATTSGTATQAVSSGSTGWPGLLPGVNSFTFTTDGNGSGSWHYNLRQEVPALSVWINNGGTTVLISDSITL